MLFNIHRTNGAMGNVCGRRGVDACELAPQTPYQSARMARKVTEQRFSSKKLQDRAGLAPGWRALNRIATVYTHILSMTVRANGVRKNRALHARIYYLYIPLGPCYSPTRSTMHSKMRYRRQANAESYADNSTLNEWIASCTSQGKSPK